MPDDALIATLKAKATLLLKREKELFELRHVRQRTEQWLRAFHRVAIDLQASNSRDLIAKWADLLVGQLNFELGGVIEYDRQTGKKIFELFDPAPLGSSTEIDPQSAAFFEDCRSGACTDASPPVLKTFGRSIGFQSFFWLAVTLRSGSQLLMLAGYSPRTAPYRSLPEHDESHFTMLGNHLAALIESSSLVAEVNRERNELRSSNRELDRSLQQLRETQARLLQSTQLVAEASRKAGMADIATGVLHNVGNVLNSVNVSVELVSHRVRDWRWSKLGALAGMLEEIVDSQQQTPDTGRQRQMVKYLRELASHTQRTQDELIGELAGLQGHVEHIKSIVNKQQEYAKTVGVFEPCSLAGLVDDALALSDAATLTYNIKVLKEFAPLPLLLLDRHKTLQIMVNLVGNAMESVRDAGRDDRVVVARILDLGRGRVQIQIEDNGLGIRAEHRAQLFTHGFTTKLRGHGFGLHSSALAAQELGGGLSFTSGGAGLGATFTLEIPATPLVHAQAAAR